MVRLGRSHAAERDVDLPTLRKALSKRADSMLKQWLGSTLAGVSRSSRSAASIASRVKKQFQCQDACGRLAVLPRQPRAETGHNNTKKNNEDNEGGFQREGLDTDISRRSWNTASAKALDSVTCREQHESMLGAGPFA